jgi:hypothetical protein
VKGISAVYGDTQAGANSGGSILYLRRAAGEPENLPDVILDICLRAGMKDHEVDVTALRHTLDTPPGPLAAPIEVRGYILPTQAEAKENLIPLLAAYDVGWVESDWTLKFVLRGSSSSRTLAEEDLGVGDNKGEAEALIPDRDPEREQVALVDVRYIDEGRDHQDNSQEAKRILTPFPTSHSSSHDKVDVPIVFQADEAQAIARRILGRIWTERTKIKSTLPPKYLTVDPLDTITATADGETYVATVDMMPVGGGWQMKMDAQENEAAIYGTAGFGHSGEYVPQALVHLLATGLIWLDTSLLRDFDNQGLGAFPVYGGFAYPRTTGFPGATAYMGQNEADMDDTFTESDQLERGTSTDTLGIVGLDVGPGFGSSQVLDTVNTVNIVMSKGTLATATDDEGFLNGDPVTGGVKGILGNEIIQAKTVVEEGDGSYTLSDLLRGRRGTEWAVINHGPGELFVVLNEDQPFTTRTIPVSMIGTRFLCHTVTRGDLFEEQNRQSKSFEGHALVPLSPVDIQAANPSGALRMRWIRRDRIGFETGWEDGESMAAPMSEEREAYEVDFLVKGTFNASDPTQWEVYRTVEINDVGGRPKTGVFTAAWVDQGGGISRITGTPTIDFTDLGFDESAWLRTEGFDDDEKNGWFVIWTRTSTYIEILTPEPGDSSGHTNASLTQEITYLPISTITAQLGGYSTGDYIDVVIYQLSGTVGRGRAGFNPLGVGPL